MVRVVLERRSGDQAVSRATRPTAASWACLAAVFAGVVDAGIEDQRGLGDDHRPAGGDQAGLIGGRRIDRLQQHGDGGLGTLVADHLGRGRQAILAGRGDLPEHRAQRIAGAGLQRHGLAAVVGVELELQADRRGSAFMVRTGMVGSLLMPVTSGGRGALAGAADDRAVAGMRRAPARWRRRRPPPSARPASSRIGPAQGVGLDAPGAWRRRRRSSTPSRAACAAMVAISADLGAQPVGDGMRVRHGRRRRSIRHVGVRRLRARPASLRFCRRARSAVRRRPHRSRDHRCSWRGLLGCGGRGDAAERPRAGRRGCASPPAPPARSAMALADACRPDRRDRPSTPRSPR